MRIGLALRCFFAVLFDSAAADRVAAALTDEGAAPAAPREPSATEQSKPVQEKKIEPPPPARSDAVSLLAALQREARFIDFVMEPLAGYSDAQVGAAARTVHDDCAKVIARMFEPRPLHEAAEGEKIDVAPGYDAARLRIVGERPSGEFKAVLQHAGWQASRCDVPQWTGEDGAARIIAAAEAEVSGGAA